jgi:hypothetical protein
LTRYPAWEGKPNVFLHVSEEVKDALEPDSVQFQEVTGKSEYIFDARSLATLHDLKKQRKDVAGFYQEFPENEGTRLRAFSDITGDEYPGVARELNAFLEQWEAAQPEEERFRHDFQQQLRGIRGMLKIMRQSDLIGQIAYVEGKIVGFTIGGKVNPSMLAVYVESAQREVKGKRADIGKSLNQRLVLDAFVDSLIQAQSPALQSNLDSAIAYAKLLRKPRQTVDDLKAFLENAKNGTEMIPQEKAAALVKAKHEAPGSLVHLNARLSLRLQELERTLRADVPNLSAAQSAAKEILDLTREIAFRRLDLANHPSVIQRVNHQEDGGEPKDKYAKELYHPLPGQGRNYSVQAKSIPLLEWNTYEDER